MDVVFADIFTYLWGRVLASNAVTLAVLKISRTTFIENVDNLVSALQAAATGVLSWCLRH
jgi:hypothetical protein